MLLKERNYRHINIRVASENTIRYYFLDWTLNEDTLRER